MYNSLAVLVKYVLSDVLKYPIETSLSVPNLITLSSASLTSSQLIIPLKVNSVEVDAPLPVTEARVSDSDVR